jgi:hypothetical protein
MLIDGIGVVVCSAWHSALMAGSMDEERCGPSVTIARHRHIAVSIDLRRAAVIGMALNVNEDRREEEERDHNNPAF